MDKLIHQDKNSKNLLNGYIDIYKNQNIIKNKNLYENKTLAFLTGRTIEIDDLYDLELARKFA